MHTIVRWGAIVASSLVIGAHVAEEAAVAGMWTRGSSLIRGSKVQSPAVTGERYALIVGISDYPAPFKDLPGPATDARRFQDMLVSVYGYKPQNVITLVNAAVTRDTVIKLIRTHLGQAGTTGTALFYYIGHGVRLKANYSVQDKETKGVDQALQVWGRGGKASVILDDELGFLLDGLKARRTLAVIDACFAGTMTKIVSMQLKFSVSTRRRHRIVPMYVAFGSMPNYDFPTSFVTDNKVIGPQRHLFLTGSREDEVAFSVKDWPTTGQSRSVFSYHLEKALRAQQPGVTMQQLHSLVVQRVAKDPICTVEKSCQRPQIGGTGAAEPISSFFGPL